MKAKALQVTIGLLVLALGVTGCATGPKGPSDEELITQTLNEWAAGLIAKDLDKLLPSYSANYADNDGNGKDVLPELLGGLIEEGYFDGLEVDFEDATTTINDDSAVVGPIYLTSDMGSLPLDVMLEKEGDRWLIVNVAA